MVRFSTYMSGILERLKTNFSDYSFSESDCFVWSPKNNTIYYEPDYLNNNLGALTLLHELGHAILSHRSFENDIELIQMELEAWEKARELAPEFEIEMNESHVQHCLDSYRMWLHERSTCPNCNSSSVQIEATIYNCFCCNTKWKVSASQQTRTHRRRIN